MDASVFATNSRVFSTELFAEASTFVSTTCQRSGNAFVYHASIDEDRVAPGADPCAMVTAPRGATDVQPPSQTIFCNDNIAIRPIAIDFRKIF